MPSQMSIEKPPTDDKPVETRGRKRSSEAEKAVLDAAYDLLSREGLQATTVEAIASRAKVSKATIYKWWPNRASVIMSAFLREARGALPYPEEFEPEDIVQRLQTMAMEFHGAVGSMIRALIAEGQSDPEIAQAFRDGYIFARRQQGVELVKRAIAKKLIRDADPDVVLDLLYAPLYYRLLVGHQPLSEAFIREHVSLALGGIMPTTSLPSSKSPSSKKGKSSF
jgi:AcrR family transcriptional regulator